MSAVGEVAFTRRYWKCTCGAEGAYAADTLLGVEGKRYTKTVQKHCCRLAAETSFASTSEHLHEMLGVDLCPVCASPLILRAGQLGLRYYCACPSAAPSGRPGHATFRSSGCPATSVVAIA